jgi:urease accessory protein
VLAGHRTAGSLLCVSPGWAGPDPVDPDWVDPEWVEPDGAGTATGIPSGYAQGVAVMPLAGPAVLVTALADDALTLRQRLCLPALAPVPGLVRSGAMG